ncbi:MAG TPA: hypothetical protein VMD30_09395 [Tepidisphaeraceae bacterium]|nr:hypothetical protein [Tepidisphaeraceae bacterium]
MSASLKDRVAALEHQVAQLQQQNPASSSGREWIDDLYGKFANDPIFARAMKLGRQYRRSRRRQSGKSKR